MKTVWLVGGGTAGHVVPLLALATELTDTDILLVTDGKTTRQAAIKDSQVQTARVNSGKFRRYHGRSWLRRLTDISTLLLNIRDIFLAGIGLLQALWLTWRHRPDAVFINGGAIGVPVAWACRLRGIPYLVHESDARIGMANRLIASRAELLLFGVETDDPFLNRLSVPTEVVGIQLRSEFFQLPSADEAKKIHELPHGTPIVLITGGSLGGRRLVDIILEQITGLTESAYVVHVTGRGNFAAAEQAKNRLEDAASERYRVIPYVDAGMATLMRAADVVISRAGATTLAELAQVGAAAIVVPNPNLPGGHQSLNADRLARHDAAMVLKESELLSDSSLLAQAVHGLLEDEKRRQQLREHIKTLAVADATERIAAHIRRVANDNKGSSK